MSGRLIRHESPDEVPANLHEYLKADQAIDDADQDLIDSPEPPENWRAHVLPQTDPLTAGQMTEVRRVEDLYTSVEARAQLLAEATKVVTVDRNAQYGAPEDTFGTIADLWSTYLSIELLPQDVANLMIMLKIARLRTNPLHRDSWVDIAGYAACGGTMPVGEEEE